MNTRDVVTAAAVVAGFFGLSPRLQPWVLAARHPERLLAGLSPASRRRAPEEIARLRDRVERALRAERERALSAIPSLGNPPVALLRVRHASQAALPATLLEVDRPEGCAFAGGEPVVCGDALVGFAEVDPDGPWRPVGRVRLLTHPQARVLGAVERPVVDGRPTDSGPIVFGACGTGGPEPHLAVRHLAERDLLEEASPVVTAPGCPGVPAGLRLGRLKLDRYARIPRVRGAAVELDAVPSQRIFLAVLEPGRARAPGAFGREGIVAGDFRDESRFRRVPASVISTGDATPGRDVFVLGAGSESGIVEGCAVTLDDALAGRVRRSGPRACQVLGAGDPEFRVHALALPPAADARALSVPLAIALAGASDLSGGTLRVFDSVPDLVGRELLTAPGEPRVPPGLLIGRIAGAAAGCIALAATPRVSIGAEIVVWVPEGER